jgi:hypothetical protein
MPAFLSLARVYASRRIGARRLSFFWAGSRGVTMTIIIGHVRGGARVHDPTALLHGKVVEGGDEGRVVPIWRGGGTTALSWWCRHPGAGAEDALTGRGAPLSGPRGEGDPRASRVGVVARGCAVAPPPWQPWPPVFVFGF